MAFTDEEEARITLIESTINQVMNWLLNTVSKLQWRQTLTHLDSTISTLTTRVTTLESQVTTIISRLDNQGI